MTGGRAVGRSVVAVVAAAAVAMVACTDLTITRASDHITTAIANPSFGRDIAPVLRQTCGSAAACHGLPTGQLGLVLEGPDSAIYAHLVNVPSAYDTAYVRVKPGQPDSSWMYMVLSDSLSTRQNFPYRMPLTELPLPPAVRQTIRNWIVNGAQLN